MVSDNNSYTKTGSAEITGILADMNEKGSFAISVLTDLQGFPIAYATTEGYDPERQAAVVAMVQKTAIQVKNHLGMGQTDEVCLFDEEGCRLVSRAFRVKDYELILALQIPDKHRSYRSLMNHSIKSIQRIWKL